MRYNRLGTTDISVSEIGLGCWALGGPSWEQGRPSGWAPVDEKDAFRAIDYARDHGVTHFDTADVYGDGLSERRLAKALGKHSHDVVIASKVGYFKGTAAHGYEPDHIRHQCEQSLINLKRDYIDIYYFHHADFGKHDCYLDDALAEMLRLRETGKIRCIALSTYAQRDFSRLVPHIRPAVIQSWAHAMDYHFIATRSPTMELCDTYSMSFIAFSPLNQGILMGKYNSAHPPSFGPGDHRSRSEKFSAPYLMRAEAGLEIIRDNFGKAPEDSARVALQFVLYHQNVAGVIPGFRSCEQVKTILAASQWPLDGEEVALVRKAFSAHSSCKS